MKAKRRLLIAGIVIGSIFTLAPIAGFLGTVFGMTRAFSVLGSSGIADPKALSDSVGTTLAFTATGLFLFPVGILVLTVSLVLLSRLRASNSPSLPGQETQ